MYFWPLNSPFSEDETTVPFIEVYQPDKNETKRCTLPQKINLKKTKQDFHRNYHTQTNLLSCGGGTLNINDTNQHEKVGNKSLYMPLTCIIYIPGRGYIHAYDLQGRVYIRTK